MYPYHYGWYGWHYGWSFGHAFWLAIAIGLALYFLPTLIARFRDAVSGGAIFLVNLLFGWTMLGWILCLVWALLAETRAHQAWRYMGYAPPGPSPWQRWY